MRPGAHPLKLNGYPAKDRKEPVADATKGLHAAEAV
jgi:hypothetical protein